MSLAELKARSRSPFVDVLIHTSTGDALSLSTFEPNFLRRLTSCRYTESDEKGVSEKAGLTFDDPDFELIGQDLFPEDAQVTLLLGCQEEALPRGPLYVKSAKPSFPDGMPQLVVELADKSAVMHQSSQFKSFPSGPLEDVIKAIAEKWGLGYMVTGMKDTKISRKVMPSGNSIPQVLTKLGKKFGFLWRIRSGVLMVNPIDQVSERVTTLHYRSGDATCLSFTPDIKRTPAQLPGKPKSIDALTEEAVSPDESSSEESGDALGDVLDLFNQSSTPADVTPPKVATALPVVQTSYDPKTNQWRVTRPEPPGRPTVGDPSAPATAPPADQEEVKNIARASNRKAKFDIQGTVIPTYPSMHYRTGDTLVIAGLPSMGTRFQFSASYIITEVEQDFSKDNWRTTSIKVKGATRKENNAALSKHDAKANTDEPSNASGEAVDDPAQEDVTLNVWEPKTGRWATTKVKVAK